MTMDTPICDFVRHYAQADPLRLHMPGHKGQEALGCEQWDITEIPGADSLYEAEGIIRKSEENAGKLFGAHTFYSTEGSSQCIRAMLYLAQLHARSIGRQPVILAGRNVHKTFLTAVALLDMPVQWLYPDGNGSYLSCPMTASQVDAALSAMPEKPTAVYLTSPDYLGNTCPISEIAAVCRRRGVLLLVDNAHGAYLKFLSPSRHPMDLGADICCDSAHKTLPVLTGGAYLHISPAAPEILRENGKNALALFGSTSPSYLILQSLDQANPYLEAFPALLSEFLPQVDWLKGALSAHGYTLSGNEPLKITIFTKCYGYLGTELASILAKDGLVCEFADPDHLVLMLTPCLGSDGLTQIRQILCAVPPRSPITTLPPAMRSRNAVVSIRQALLSPARWLPVEHCVGKILASPSVGCPPAVPIAICGERIDQDTIDCFRYYGISQCAVISE